MDLMTHFYVVAFAGMIESWLLGEIDRGADRLCRHRSAEADSRRAAALGGGNQKTVAQVRPDGASGRIFCGKSGFCA